MSEAEFRLSADTTAARKEVASFRREYAEMVRAVEKPIAQVDALRTVQESAKKASAEFFAAKNNVNELKAAMAQAGQPVKELDRELVKAERTLARATVEFDRQKAKVREQRAELRAAGVDTRNLATEQQRLQAEMAKAMGAGRRDLAVAGIRERTAELQKQAVAQRQINLESARQNLGVNRYRQLQAELVSTRQQYQLLRTSGKLTAAELSVAQRAMTQRVRETQFALRALNTEQLRTRRGGGLAGMAGGAAGGYLALRTITGVTRQADEWTELTDRIRLATTSEEEYRTGLERLREISDRTFTSMTNNAELYIGALSPLRERGFSGAEVLQFTETLGLGLVASAAKGERAAAVIQQLNNALQDGQLRGEAFNSMIRNTPALADALARGLGRTREQLKAMADEGKLTTDVWVPGLLTQTDELGKAVDNMNVTVGDGMVRVMNAWREAIGKADIKPLTDALQELANVIRDPAVSQGLTSIGSFIVHLGAFAVGTTADLGGMATQIGTLAAKAEGAADRLADIDAEIKAIDQSLDESWTAGDLLVRLFYSPEELKAKREELRREREQLIQDQTGMNAEMQFLAEVANEVAKQAREKDVANYRKYAQDLGSSRDKAVKEAEAHAKRLVSVEKALTKDLADAREERKKLEERFKALRSPGGEATPSYLNVLDLQQKASLALKANDTLGAKKAADEALAMLEKLKDAGENMYGYDSLITSLEGVAMAVSDIDTKALESKLAGAQISIALLKQDAEQLKNTTIGVTVDEAGMDAARSAIEALVSKLSRTEVVLPVRLAMPAGMPASAETPPGFAAGGRIRGPGTGTSDSILARLSNGEFVVRAAAVRHYGPELLERLNQMRLQRFATGGQVGRALPAIPQPSQALLNAGAAPEFPHLGSINLSLGGTAYTVYADSGTADELRLAARKFGRTRT